jgi:hypothetical protein
MVFNEKQISNGASLQNNPHAITITLYMDRTYKIRKLGVDKIALLGLFGASLLIAHMIVVSRSAILLSEPIQLKLIGLSVSMPDGNGWKSNKQWNPYENGFSLRSSFSLGANPTAEARCVYNLSAETFDPQNLFVQKADEVEGEIKKVEQIEKDTLVFNWTHIENPKNSRIVIFGTAKLPRNHRLDIEVQQIVNDPKMAEQVFKKIINSLNYKGNQLI